MTEKVRAAQAWLDENRDQLIADTQRMLRINSIESAPAPNAPFGAGNREALDLALNLCEEAGMKTTDLEGNLGYADFGAGERLIMTLGHLDVVPVGPGWKYPPFGAEIQDGYIYARGATDDKGPSIAALYALRSIKQTAGDLGVRFRVAFGCDEESGFLCVDRYVATEEIPTYGVAPDSGWPCYNAEKGIADFLVTVTPPAGEFALVELVGGQRPNIVIDAATARVNVSPSFRPHVEQKLAGWFDKNVSSRWERDSLYLEAVGKAAHGSRPFTGDNAATRLVRFLLAAAPLDGQDFFGDLLEACHPSGVGLGIFGLDDVAGDLTSNLGIVGMKDGRIEALFNIRYCATWSGDQLREKCQKKLDSLTGDWRFSVERDSPPLYFPADHPMVRAIVDVHAEETGRRLEPGSMGGGTYARAVPNTISIGTGWVGDGDAHETDERVAVESLLKMAKIYAHIFLRLAALPA